MTTINVTVEDLDCRGRSCKIEVNDGAPSARGVGRCSDKCPEQTFPEEHERAAPTFAVQRDGEDAVTLEIRDYGWLQVSMSLAEL